VVRARFNKLAEKGVRVFETAHDHEISMFVYNLSHGILV
jgi:hypothetical protein